MDGQKVKQWIAEGNTQAIEDAWLQAVEAAAPARQMRATLDILADAGLNDLANTLGWMLLTETVDRLPAGEALDVARTILPALTGNEELRGIAAELYRKVHGQARHFNEFLRASGLQAGQSPRRAIRALDICLAVRGGEYLANRFDGQVVHLQRFEVAAGCFELTRAGGESEQIEPLLLGDSFQPVADTDFRVLRWFRREHLDEQIRKDPAAVLIGICMTHGGRIDAAELKQLLAGQYVPADKWSGWWNRARTAVKRCRQLSLEGSNPAVITYHPRGRTLEAELARDVRDARSPTDLLAVLQEYSRELRARKSKPDPEFLEPIMATLAEQADVFRDRRPVDALAASLTIEAAAQMSLPGPEASYPTGADALAAMDEPAEAVVQLAAPSLWPHAFEALATRDDAGDQFEKLLTLMPADQLDAVAARLTEAGRSDAVRRAVQNALAEPTANWPLCVWLWRGPAEPLDPAPAMLELLSRLLRIMQELARDPGASRPRRREAFRQIRSALVAENCRGFRAALEEMDEGVAETIKRRIRRSSGLTVSSRDTLLGLLRDEFYSLFLTVKVEPWLDESVIWATPAAIRRKQDELRQIEDVTIPANSRAIGVAAEKGDLSENSEWQYAIEERRRLQAAAARIRGELAIARPLNPHDVPTDSVGIGSQVTLNGADGRRVELTVLGPWESDAGKRIYSYKTPLALSILGKGAGTTLTLKLDGAEGRYTIERIEPACWA